VPNPHPAEVEAVQQAGMLLRFAAENVKDVPQNVVSAIAASWEAKDTDRWTTTTSSEFWSAFHTLCLLIKPVSLDSLAANLPGPALRRWQIWRSVESVAPLAKRTARGYLVVLLICLALAVLGQFLVTTSATMSEEIDRLLAGSDRTATKINQEIATAETGADTGSPNGQSTTTANEIRNDFDSLWFDVDKTGNKLNLLEYITPFGRYRPYETGALYPVTSVTAAQQELTPNWL
jgi:hypothetical protein